MPGLLLFGITLLFAIGAGMFKRVKNQRTAIGEAVSLDPHNDPGESAWRVWVEYEVDGRIYAIKSKHISRSFHIGQKFKIAYNDENPNEAFIKPTSGDYIVFFILFAFAVYITIHSL